MRASGNGNPRVCAENIMKCVRGEVPYERIKGIDPRIIDAPTAEVKQRLMQDAGWLFNAFEPRAKVTAIDIIPTEGAAGGFSIALGIEEKEG